jgi:hypothetical protein
MFDINQKPYDEEYGELDEEAFEQYIDHLMEEFAESPEAQTIIERVGQVSWAGAMVEYAMHYPGVTPPGMSVGDFEEVVFEIFPRKVSTEASNAGEIIAELRAFWEFLRRAYQLKNADKILAKLTPAAVPRLERELANPRNFGMAKSFFMQGQELGFDMTQQEGIDAFMNFYNSRLLESRMGGPPDFGAVPDFEDLPDMPPLPPSPLTPREKADLRKKRKAQRQAKKRGRRKK